MTESTVLDEAVRVTVTPSQASYFAGDTFTVTITITNIRRPEAPLAVRSTSQSAAVYGHKRGAHSVSYVPMARPPTSPGVRTALPAVPASHSADDDKPVVRRGLVGKPRAANGFAKLEEQEAQARKRVNLTKSLSVSLGTQDFQSNGSEDWKGKSPLRTLQTGLPTPNSPHISSPLARSASVPENHPHARKQSIMDGQVQVQPLKDSDKVPPDLTVNSSVSTLSLALDPITEGYSPISPATPDVVSPAYRHDNLTSSASFPPAQKVNGISDGVSRANGHKPPHLGAGLGPPPRLKTTSTGNFSSPNTELILYSYAQLTGTVTLHPAHDSPLSPEQRHLLHMLRRELQATKAIGGGNMNIVPNSPKALARGRKPLPAISTRRAAQHSRSVSLSTGLLSLISPTSLMPSSPPPLVSPTGSSRHSRNSSVFSGFFGSSSSNVDADGPDWASVEEDANDADEPLPTFDVPPAMVAIDLSLMAGQSRTYVYTLPLPRNLPPTYRGRTLRFQYEFVLGVCRSANSRIMRVPVRIYNYVSVTSSLSPYDFRWPVMSKSQRQACKATVTDERGAAQHPPPGSTPDQAQHDLRPYALALLSAHDPAGPRMPRRDSVGRFSFAGGAGDEEPDLGCRESIEILTRNPKRLSFDVHKDDVKVAVLTFTKSAYRLGETVLGVVNLNARAARARVLKLSAFLESHETLPSCLSSAVPSAAAQTRRIHAESHASFVGSTLRTVFALDIPSDASPAFQVVVSAPGAPGARPGGLEWKVRLCLLVAIAGPDARAGEDGVRLKHLVRDGPRGEWGMAWCAPASMVPRERPHPNSPFSPTAVAAQKSQSWTSFFSSALLGTSEPSMNFHDGDEESELDDEDGEALTEGEWRDVRAEMVECEVPIRVWPGNTAFKAGDVVFEV